MDDETTETGSRGIPPAPPPGTPPAWGPPPPPPTGWQQPRGTGAQSVLDGRPRLEPLTIIGRTFDTLGREWSLFLALAIPAGLAGFLSAVLSPSLQAIARDPAPSTTASQVGTAGLQVLITLLSGLSTLATIVAADALWRGREIGVGGAVRGAVRALPRAIGLLLIVFVVLLAVGIALVAGFLVVGTGGGAAAVIASFVALVLVVLAVWVGTRLSVAVPVLVLERTPVRAVLRRAWSLTRGNAVGLFLTALVIGLCGLLPSWGATLFSLFVDDRLVAGIALGLASLVVAPLGGIWTALAWGRLAGEPHADSPLMTTGRGRFVGFTLVAGVGLLLLAVGGALGAAGSAEFLRLTQGN